MTARDGDDNASSNDYSNDDELNSNELVSAASEGLIEKVDSLLGSGHDISGKVGRGALHYAAINGHAAVVTSLLAAGAPIESVCGEHKTPLIIAAEFENFDVIEVLLAAGANAAAGTVNFGQTALSFVAISGHVEAVKSLLEAGACVDGFEGISSIVVPLVEAAKYGHVEVVDLLLEAGADVENYDEHNNAAIDCAAENGHLETVSSLLAAGANIEGSSELRTTPLILAAKYGYVEVVKLLLAAGADIEAAEDDGSTALSEAVQKGCLDVVHVLIKSGVNVNSRLPWDDTSKCTTLFLAIDGRDTRLDIVHALLDAGAEPDGGIFKYEKKPDGSMVDIGHEETPLIKAATYDGVDIVRVLLERGANVNIKGVSKFGKTALMRGSLSGDFEVVQALLDAGGDPFIQTSAYRYEPITTVVQQTAIWFTNSDRVCQLLAQEMRRYIAAAISALSTKVPPNVVQEIIRAAYSW